MLYVVVVIGSGIGLYFLTAKRQRYWPYFDDAPETAALETI
jgi:hypothetical protein